MPLGMSVAKASGVNRTLRVSLRRLMLTFFSSNTSSAAMGWGSVWLMAWLGGVWYTVPVVAMHLR